MHGLSPTNLFCLCDLWNLWSFGGQAQGVLKGSSVICGILGPLWRPPKFWFDIFAQDFAGTLQFMHHELRSQQPRGTNARHVEILWFGLELWKLRKHSFWYYFLHLFALLFENTQMHCPGISKSMILSLDFFCLGLCWSFTLWAFPLR